MLEHIAKIHDFINNALYLEKPNLIKQGENRIIQLRNNLVIIPQNRGNNIGIIIPQSLYQRLTQQPQPRQPLQQLQQQIQPRQPQILGTDNTGNPFAMLGSTGLSSGIGQYGNIMSGMVMSGNEMLKRAYDTAINTMPEIIKELDKMGTVGVALEKQHKNLTELKLVNREIEKINKKVGPIKSSFKNIDVKQLQFEFPTAVSSPKPVLTIDQLLKSDAVQKTREFETQILRKQFPTFAPTGIVSEFAKTGSISGLQSSQQGTMNLGQMNLGQAQQIQLGNKLLQISPNGAVSLTNGGINVLNRQFPNGMGLSLNNYQQIFPNGTVPGGKCDYLCIEGERMFSEALTKTQQTTNGKIHETQEFKNLVKSPAFKSWLENSPLGSMFLTLPEGVEWLMSPDSEGWKRGANMDTIVRWSAMAKIIGEQNPDSMYKLNTDTIQKSWLDLINDKKLNDTISTIASLKSKEELLSSLAMAGNQGKTIGSIMGLRG